MEEFIAADPVTADHHSLFSDLQKWSLDWRLKDPFASLVRKNQIINLGQSIITSLLNSEITIFRDGLLQDKYLS